VSSVQECSVNALLFLSFTSLWEYTSSAGFIPAHHQTNDHCSRLGCLVQSAAASCYQICQIYATAAAFHVLMSRTSGVGERQYRRPYPVFTLSRALHTGGVKTIAHPFRSFHYTPVTTFSGMWRLPVPDMRLRLPVPDVRTSFARIWRFPVKVQALFTYTQVNMIFAPQRGKPGRRAYMYCMCLQDRTILSTRPLTHSLMERTGD
jgi:hypothetical protein